MLFDEEAQGGPAVVCLDNAYGWISELAQHKYSRFPKLSLLCVLTPGTDNQQNDSLVISGKEWDYSLVEEVFNCAEIN